ncbi:MAG: HXXEE domain-containing protein [Pyrinomonadaceae bacterium]|nr:HXXEE domain-containing protein [Pyrinomonadaceae bacterium]
MTSDQVNHLFSITSTTLWSWLFPITYLFHIAEEFWGGEGYSAFLLKQRGIQLSPTRFLLVQAIGLALMIVGMILARRLQSPKLLTVILGAVVLVNGLNHTILSLAHREYIPGLITSILLWIPLGIATLVGFRATMRGARYWLCVALGIAINGFIELITSKAGHFF